MGGVDGRSTENKMIATEPSVAIERRLGLGQWLLNPSPPIEPCRYPTEGWSID